ncbi:hypothetical protein DXG01_006145 [Tephrocybe rancida]|nr:hypothetical protein DXG01_006145 [Tephrocybe rancida]
METSPMRQNNPEHESTGTSNSSSNASDYSSDDEMHGERGTGKVGFGFSTASWNSKKPATSDREVWRYEPEWKREARYRDGGSYNDFFRDMEGQRGRRMLTRSVQTDPVVVVPFYPNGPRTYLRMLTPSRYRHNPRSTSRGPSEGEREWEQEQEREWEWEKREREHEWERKRETQRAKYRYESRIPPPPPPLSAPLTLRIPPLASTSKKHNQSLNVRSFSNTHTRKNPYPPTTSTDSQRDPQAHGASQRDRYTPPRVMIPARNARRRYSRAEENHGHDDGEDEVHSSENEEYEEEDTQSAGPSNARTSDTTAKRRRASTLTPTFLISTPASLARATAAAAAAAAVRLPSTQSSDADAEKARIPTLSRAGKTRYACVACPKDFSRRNDAYRHMRRAHNEGPDQDEFVCVCGKVLSRADALRRHMRSCRQAKEGVAGVMGGKNYAFKVGMEDGDLSMEEEEPL